LGYPIPPWRHRVTGSPSRVSYRLRPPDAFAFGFILSCAWPLLQSFSSRTGPALMSGLPSLGLHSLIAASSAESTGAGIPGPHRSVLDVSHVLDGFLLHRLRRFISPRDHVQGSLFRGFPWQEAARAHRSPLPSCRYARDRPRPIFMTRVPIARARLQGLAPLASPLRHTVV